MRTIQDFEQENISMSRPKTPDHPPLKQPTKFIDKYGKGNVQYDPDPEP